MPPTSLRFHIGILALQGNYIQHKDTLSKLNQELKELDTENISIDLTSSFIISKKDLEVDYDGIILPGGESTTMLHLLQTQKMREALIDKISGKIGNYPVPTLATCAGVILLANKLHNHPKDELPPLGISHLEVCRNAYGRQTESFFSEVLFIDDTYIKGLFIRAPKIHPHPISTEIINHSFYEDSLVIVEEKHVDAHLLLCTFHPEACFDTTLHRYFVKNMILPHSSLSIN